MAGELQLMFKVHQQLPVSCRHQEPGYLQMMFFRPLLSCPSFDKDDGFLIGGERITLTKAVLWWWPQRWSSGLGHIFTCIIHPQMPFCSNRGCLLGFLAWKIMSMLVSANNEHQFRAVNLCSAGLHPSRSHHTPGAASQRYRSVRLVVTNMAKREQNNIINLTITQRVRQDPERRRYYHQAK